MKALASIVSMVSMMNVCAIPVEDDCDDLTQAKCVLNIDGCSFDR